MAYENLVVIIGNLGKDPELRFPDNGQSVADFSVATNEKWTDHSGKKQERTEWHSVAVWGKLAEACGKHLKKGSKVYVRGKLRTEKWKDSDGAERQRTRVVASTVQFLDGAEPTIKHSGHSGRPQARRQEMSEMNMSESWDGGEDGIPF